MPVDWLESCVFCVLISRTIGEYSEVQESEDLAGELEN
jgi:hypothetical protein